MLHVSQRALEAICEALDQADPDPDRAFGFRVLAVSGPGGDACGPMRSEASLEIGLDVPDANDEIVAWDERPVLILARPVAALLDGTTVDLCELGNGERQLAIEMCGAVQ
jgi:hypothetical protein